MKLKYYSNKKEIILGLYKNHSCICKYRFKSHDNGTYIGQRLIFITLLRYAILDCLAIDELEIKEELMGFEIDYINKEIETMIDYSKRNHDLQIPFPKIKTSIAKNKIYQNINLDTGKCYIGYSGGKDSSLCLDLIKNSFEEIVKFKINFDEEFFDNEYHEKKEVINKEAYDNISTKVFYERNNKNYYQEEDLHCCFAAPYYSVANSSPAFLSVGLQYDVINYYVYDKVNKITSEFGLTETYNSVKTFEKLLKSYGLCNFKIFVPLASATSFVIYNILRIKYGDEKLRSMNSCWNPLPENTPCGECLKCQRVSYIYKLIGMELTPIEKSSLGIYEKNNNNLDYLFGSISVMNLLTNYYKDNNKLKSILFTDEKIQEIDLGFSEKIGKLFDFEIIQNPLKKEVHFNSIIDEQKIQEHTTRNLALHN